MYCIFRVNVSWNEAAAQCEHINGHLPFFKTYSYDNFPHLNERLDYLNAMEMIQVVSGHQRLGDITFIGLDRKVCSPVISVLKPY